jgi:hypothetical protein
MMNKKREHRQTGNRQTGSHPMENLAEVISVDIAGRYAFLSPITSSWEKKQPNVYVSATEISGNVRPGLFVQYEKIEKGPRGLFATGVTPL